MQQDFITSRRFELKYKLSRYQYFQIRNALIPFIEMDPFTSAAPNNLYLVRSLYFDTSDYQAYYEKINGDANRVKFRIRTYSKTIDSNPTIRVELKVRKGVLMEKYSYFSSLPEYQKFMDTWHWSVENNPVLDEFERNLHIKHLRPKVLVQYLREGFTSRDREDLRITFDHKVQSAYARSLFPKNAFFRPHHNQSIILEIKHYKKQPRWLTTLIRRHGLKIIANSKYAQGIEVASPDLVTPAWSNA